MTLTDKARAGFASITIRGGRITKWKGQAASYSPQLGSLAVGVSGAALAAALALTPTAAEAGECNIVPTGTSTCEDPADPATDVSQVFDANGNLTVETLPGFGITVASGPAISITNSASITFEDENASAIIGASRGLFINATASGIIRVTSNGSFEATNTDGIGANISAGPFGITELTVDVNDTTGGQSGLLVFNGGSGVASVTSRGTATGASSSGISVVGESSGGGIVINSADAFGGYSGINANNSRRDITITSSGLAGGGTNGIRAVNLSAARSIFIDAVDSSGGANGISVTNGGSPGMDGPGVTTVISRGLAEGGTNGILITAAAGQTDVTVTSNNVTGGTNGINVTNNGTGMLSITSVEDDDGNRIGTARGTTGNAIFAENTASGIGIAIAVNDAIAGTVNPDGSVTGGNAGILAVNRGTAEVPEGSTATNGITITANNTTGGRFGIRAENNAPGALTVISTGTATGTGAFSEGISVYNRTGGGTVSVSAVDAVGVFDGINAVNSGTGAMTIEATGTVIGTNRDGVDAFQRGGDLTITVEDATGGENGVKALQSGTGDLTITVRGTAIGTSGFGIEAGTLGAPAGDLTITANNTVGEFAGIRASTASPGFLTITSTGSATSTGMAGFGINANIQTLGTGASITANDAAGGTHGIRAVSIGTGMLSITSVEDDDGNRIGTARGTNGSGIFAENAASGIGITIAVNDAIGGTVNPDGTITGGVAGINAINRGTAAVPTGSTATNGLTITANNTAGGDYGIRALNEGSGDLSITSMGTATGGTGSGIIARNGISGGTATGDLTITARNSTGGGFGILATQYGSGDTTITSEGLASGGAAGIVAENFGGNVTINAYNATGGRYGIQGSNTGTGALSITATGLVQSTSTSIISGINYGPAGILATNGPGATTMTIDAADVRGHNWGIRADNAGSGKLTITSTGTVTGTVGAGILARNYGAGLEIDATDVNGGRYGISAINTGSGDLSITAANTSGSQYGIRAVDNGTGMLSITSVEDDDGNRIGTARAISGTAIAAENTASGIGITIAVNDAISGVEEPDGGFTGGFSGITAINRGTAAVPVGSTATNGLTITANNTAGRAAGIYGSNIGSGALSITSTGNATSEELYGILARNSGTSLAINSANATGGLNGIDAINSGSGSLSIISTGVATGNFGRGIAVDNAPSGTDLLIDFKDSIGGSVGVLATNRGTGNLSIISSGTARGTTLDGIFAANAASGIGVTIAVNDAIAGAEQPDGSFTGGFAGINAINRGRTAPPTGSTATDGLTITANNTVGGQYGIRAVNDGSGALTITSTGTASGTSGVGIEAQNGAAATDLTITANNVKGSLEGIRALNNGTGDLTITAIGLVEVTSPFNPALPLNGHGIRAENTAADGGVTVSAKDVTGSLMGIFAIGRGSGDVNITATGTVTSGFREAVYGFSNSSSGNTITIDSKNSYGGSVGVQAVHFGSGAISITATGTSYGRGRYGVFAVNGSVVKGTDIEITAADSTGRFGGIAVTNRGTGITSITSTGTATGLTPASAGISVFHSGTDLSVDAKDTSGGAYGVEARNTGTGVLTITSTGLAQATSTTIDPASPDRPTGIFATNAASATDLSITANDTSGAAFGIRAINNGTGMLAINSVLDDDGNRIGTARSTNGTAIAAENAASGIGITIAVNDAIAGTEDLDGSFTGGFAGINAVNRGTADVPTGSTATNGLAISANSAIGGTDGINARNEGSGALTITTTGRVAGGSGNGITASSYAFDYRGYYAYPVSTGTSIDITTQAEVSGESSGIVATSLGTGSITINAGATVSGSSFAGINAFNSSYGESVSVTANNTSGDRYGILVGNLGSGGLTVSSSGNAIGTRIAGISVQQETRDRTIARVSDAALGPLSTPNRDVLVESNNATGGQYGIRAVNLGTGSLTISSTGLAEATATAFNFEHPEGRSGIFARNLAGSTDLTITANNTSGNQFGIRAINEGTGMLSIAAVEDEDGNLIGTARSAALDAIFAENTASGIGMRITVNNAFAGTENPDGTFTGGATGINAINRGMAAVPEDSTATNGLTISANNTSGAEFGIRARHYGTGALTITSAGTATATELRGLFTTAAISAETGSDSSGLVIESFNASGAQVGISARHSGSGILSVTSTGLASGAASRGIFAVAAAGSAADVVVTSQDAYGRLDGIFASQGGSGALTVNSKGTARGSATLSSSRGISVSGLLQATDITVNAASAFGRNNGISVRHYGTGSITVTATGDVTGNFALVAAGGGRNVQVDAFNTSGVYAGIAASNRGNGSTEIVSRGIASASSEYGDAIRVTNVAGSTSMSITSNIATGGLNGITATNSGTGALTITSQGAATGTIGSGITATNGGAGTDLTINAGDTTGGNYGIRAINDGSGALTITSTGSARGTALDGIYAVNAAAASAEAGVSNDTTVIAVNSAGGRTGIRALHDGAGALSVTSTGLAEGTGSGADGIYARGRNGSSGVTIASNNAAGDRFGILARNGGGGVLTVTSTGLAEGGTDDGINAATLPGGGATDIVVSAQDTSGGRSGLRVIQNGTGVVRVDSKGHANGTRFRGIDVGSGANSSGVIVNAASATGGINGIFVGHYGTGTVTVTATGDITGFNALVAANAGDNTRVTAVNTIGSNVGISADARGNGVVEVVSTGTASASDARGRAIELSNRAGGTAMSLASNNAVGGLTGIRARNAGVGAITILSSGNAVGEAEDGILAINEASATNITITANATSGGITGINAQNNGTGALAITTSGATSGTAQTGIDALNRGTSLAITTGGAVTGGVDGIRARNYGTGGLTIIANGDVTGGTGAAINAFNSANDVTASMLVEQAAGTSFTGATDGIIADNAGGSLTVNALGTLVGTTGSGVNAVNQATATGMTLRVNNASGAVSGIAANNQGTGPASITLTGTAQGGSGAGIDTASAAGNLTTITLAAGARALAGASGVAIANNAGNANLNVASGASVVGEVRMGGGSDTATFSGSGALAGITVLDGGDDIDALTLNGVVATLAASRIINWESLAIAAGSDVAITGLATGALSVTDSTAVLTDLVSGTVTSSNAQLTLNGATTLAGVLTCRGTLTVAGASAIGSGGLLGCAAADTITVSGDARVAGNIEGAGGADVIAVLGNASVTGAILGGGAGADNSGAADGSDTITIDTTGSVARIDSGLGDDVIALRGGTVAGDVLGGSGNDAVTLSGARIAGAIDAGAGADVITLSAGSAAAVLGNDGNDAISLAGATITGALDGGAGDDGIALSGGSADTVLGGTGNDTIALTGAAIAGAIDGGAGADVLALSSGSAASVSGGDGNDAITLAGATITGALEGGAGNDVIALEAGSAGSVLGGEGDDRVRWNSAAATTTSIQLGAGADTLDINSAAVSLAGVTLDGGEGADTLNLNANWTGDLVGARTTNWDVININGGTIRISDSALTAGLVNVNESGRLNASNNLALTGNLAIAGGGRLLAGTAAGNNAAGVSGNLANGGLIDLRGPGGQTAVGDRLTIGGNLTGLAGSSIRLDAVLGASQTSDLIVVRGNLSGSGEVIVNNVGGIGALTTGDGIRLVQVDGTSAAGALTLAGGTIDVGAFRYALQNGGLADPGDSDWYLRSRVRDIVVPTISIARLAQDMSLAALGTLNQRTGEQQHLTLQSGDSGFLKGMWGRALGKDYSETVQSVGLGDVSTEGRLGGLQAGVDLYRAVAASGSRTSIGVFGGHLWSSTSDVSFSGFARSAGTTSSDGWTLGGYVTHVAASGWYVDAVVQRDWLDHRANAADGTAAATQSRSTLASLEVGKAFGKVWKFEPQAQLIYGDTRIDAFADSRGIANRLTVEDNVIGRGGFRLKRTWDHDENSDGGLFTVYAKANIWGRLDGGAGALSVGASVPGALQMREVWGDVGFGTTFSVARNAEFFSEFDVEYGIDQGGTALAGRGGFRLRF